MKESGFNRIKQELRGQLTTNLEKKTVKKTGRKNLAVKKSTNAQPGERDCDPQQRSKLNHWNLKVNLPGLVNGF